MKKKNKTSYVVAYIYIFDFLYIFYIFSDDFRDSLISCSIDGAQENVFYQSFNKINFKFQLCWPFFLI